MPDTSDTSIEKGTIISTTLDAVNKVEEVSAGILHTVLPMFFNGDYNTVHKLRDMETPIQRLNVVNNNRDIDLRTLETTEVPEEYRQEMLLWEFYNKPNNIIMDRIDEERILKEMQHLMGIISVARSQYTHFDIK